MKKLRNIFIFIILILIFLSKFFNGRNESSQEVSITENEFLHTEIINSEKAKYSLSNFVTNGYKHKSIDSFSTGNQYTIQLIVLVPANEEAMR